MSRPLNPWVLTDLSEYPALYAAIENGTAPNAVVLIQEIQRLRKDAYELARRVPVSPQKAVCGPHALAVGIAVPGCHGCTAAELERVREQLAAALHEVACLKGQA